jgi:DNA repair exonuclease SbcCD nuclease subunit
MGRIFVRGDIHGDIMPVIEFIHKFDLGEGDSILILGDCGIAWRNGKKDLEKNIELFENECNGASLMFIAGNHENYDILNEYKATSRDENGMVHLSNHIIYLPNGEYMLNNRKVLVCGGADSIDRAFRVEGLSWWADERVDKDFIMSIPAETHYDYVFTHCCPYSVFKDNSVYLIQIPGLDQSKIGHISEEYLDILKSRITFDHWWFAHYHVNRSLSDGFRCLLDEVIEMEK